MHSMSTHALLHAVAAVIVHAYSVSHALTSAALSDKVAFPCFGSASVSGFVCNTAAHWHCVSFLCVLLRFAHLARFHL